jgi:hypothetical protein
VASIEALGGGIISDEVYQDPGQDTVLESCTSSVTDIRIEIVSAYPLIEVTTTVSEYPVQLTVAADDGHYSGTVDVQISTDGESIEVQQIAPDGTDGAVVHIPVTVELPPELLTLSYTGTYPGVQTEYKENDTVSIIGTTDIPCYGVEIMAPTGAYSDGACKGEFIYFAPTTSISVTATIADQGDVVVARPAYVRALNAVDAAGAVRATDELGGTTDHVDLVNCNNYYYSIVFGTPTYPGSQGALKDSETATVPITIAGYGGAGDTILHTSPTSELSITSPTTYQDPKTVQRIAGTYNDSTDNLRVSVTRGANGATTVDETLVKIAHVDAVIGVSEPFVRLQSGGNDGTTIKSHTITITSDQELLIAPTLPAAAGGGTFIGSWAGGPKVWTRTLQVHDDDVKGIYGWSGLVATNLAGKITNTITGDASYELGGFVARDLTFGPFSQSTTLNVAVITYSKLQAGVFTATNQPAIRHTPQGDQSDATNEYTILSPLGTNPQTLWWNDVAAASTNSTGTAQITDVEEVP